MKHTKGPWSFAKNDPNWVVKGPHLIAMVSDAKGERNITDRTIANARLIAAAPEMLDALKIAVSIIEEKLCQTDEMKPIYDAIKKAKGE